ncbi:MAG TPA: phosphotransferase [Solirubrobacterales bacterium]
MASRHPPLGGDAGSLSDVLATVEPDARLVAEERLTSHVRRVTLTRGRRSSLIVKWVTRMTARKTELLNSRWLPAAGLKDRGSPLLASAPGPGDSAWQVFEDLGDCALLPDRPEPGDLEVATHLVAQLHVAFAGHSLLREWIDEFGGLDERFYADWVRQAARALEAIGTSSLSPDRLTLRDRLCRRVDALLAEEPGRTQRLQEADWPVTLLHGDLWPQNVLLSPHREGRRARLIDWDQARVGPVVYDLSTFVYRLSSHVRVPVLRLYRRAVRTVGWDLPNPADLNDAFETAEYARLASCLISPAEAAGEGADWAFEDLRAVDRWFAATRPVLS